MAPSSITADFRYGGPRNVEISSEENFNAEVPLDPGLGALRVAVVNVKDQINAHLTKVLQRDKQMGKVEKADEEENGEDEEDVEEDYLTKLVPKLATGHDVTVEFEVAALLPKRIPSVIPDKA